MVVLGEEEVGGWYEGWGRVVVGGRGKERGLGGRGEPAASFGEVSVSEGVQSCALQCVAVCRSMLQCVPAERIVHIPWIYVSQLVTVCCGAVCCSMLQYVAVCRGQENRHRSHTHQKFPKFTRRALSTATHPRKSEVWGIKKSDAFYYMTSYILTPYFCKRASSKN